MQPVPEDCLIWIVMLLFLHSTRVFQSSKVGASVNEYAQWFSNCTSSCSNLDLSSLMVCCNLSVSAVSLVQLNVLLRLSIFV